MKFKTYSGSIYELDQENKKARRLSGRFLPTERQGKDEEWREYQTLLFEPTKGKSLVIVWSINEDGTMKTTQTSLITEFLEEN